MKDEKWLVIGGVWTKQPKAGAGVNSDKTLRCPAFVRLPRGRSSASPVESLSSSPLPGCEATIEWLPIIEGYERTECRAGQTGSKPKKALKSTFWPQWIGMAKSAFLDHAALVDDNSLTQGSVDPHLKAGRGFDTETLTRLIRTLEEI